MCMCVRMCMCACACVHVRVHVHVCMCMCMFLISNYTLALVDNRLLAHVHKQHRSALAEWLEDLEAHLLDFAIQIYTNII